MFIQSYSNIPQGYVGGDRFTLCPEFGDTQNNISVKFVYFEHQNNQIIRIPYKHIKETFLDLLKRYKKQIEYKETQQKQIIIKNIKTEVILGFNERLQFYKEQVEDCKQCYFCIIQRKITTSQKLLNQQDKSKIDHVLQEKQYKQQRFYDVEDKISLVIVRNNEEIPFDGYKEQTVQELRCDICKKFHLNLNEFTLIFAGKPLNNEQSTLNSLSITHESVVLMVMKAQSGCFSVRSKIKKSPNEDVLISDLKRNDTILSYNQREKKMEEDQIVSIHKTNMQFVAKIVLEDRTVIQCSPTHKFYTNKGWKNYEYNEKQPQSRLKIGDRLINIQNKQVPITSIELIELPQVEPFYHLSIKNNNTFLINDFITHNMQIRIISNQDGVEFFINTSEYDTIFQIKSKIEDAYKIPYYEQMLLLGSKQLKNDESISDYAIDFKNTTLRLLRKEQEMIVIHRSKQKRQYKFNMHRKDLVSELKQLIAEELDIPLKHQILLINNIEMSQEGKLSEYPIKENYNRINLIEVENEQVSKSVARFMSNKSITIKIRENQSLKMNYYIFKQISVGQFVSAVIPNSRPSYALLFGDLLLNPSQKLCEIQKYSLFNQQNIECVVVRNYDRLIFMDVMSLRQPFNKGLIKNVTKSEIQLMNSRYTKIENTLKNELNLNQLNEQQLSLKEVIESIQYFTCDKPYKDLDRFLYRMKTLSVEESRKLPEYNFCSSLTRSLIVLPKFIGTVHRVVHHFSVADHYKEEQTFYWSTFITTHLNQADIKPFITTRCTIFHIQSLTGRSIGTINSKNNNEVVFLPFTYFYIERIIRKEKLDEVWMIEMPTPLTFAKNIMIWVDDNPKNNKALVQKYKNKIEIMQLINTKIAEQWIRQFGWILKRKGIGCKMISDMVRQQGKDKQMVYQAGIDLLELFHNNYGFTTPILIYCFDVNKAKENILNRKIAANRISSVTGSELDVIQFCQN